MRAALYSINGPASVLRIAELPDPVPGPDEVLIRVEAISIEGGDILSRQHIPPSTADHVLGFQVAGFVVSVGEAVDLVRVGEHVAAFNWQGSHAELFVTPQHYVYPIPPSVDSRVAAAVPVAFGTAHDALFEFGNLESGETVVILGATGGVGLAAVQLAKLRGAKVIAVASSPERLWGLSTVRTDHLINYKMHNVASEILRLTGGNGAELVVDLVGGSLIREVLGSVRYRGRLSVVGAASGENASIPLREIGGKSLTVSGVSFGKEMHLPRVRGMLSHYFISVAQGLMTMPIDRTYALADVAKAHQYAQHGHPFGRVVMTP